MEDLLRIRFVTTHYPKRVHASNPPEAYNVINDKTQCSQRCIVWPPPCLCNGFSLLEELLCSHL